MSAIAYGRMDRAVHRLAFATRRSQIGVADLEETIFRRELRATEVGPPVFVTALPRAGTTMLLQLLAACPEFAVHTNRDAPFVLCPMLWRAFTRRFRRPVQPRERAHGDGILVTADSPEAMEEVLWSAFWPEHYGARTITPWSTCQRPDFVEFFARHRRKIVALRAREQPRARRYLAKNNVHIARLPALWSLLPEAKVVVPFRDPVQQAASLLRQHLRFVQMHTQDPFTRRYMTGMGHREFGLDLRPIDFDGWFADRDPQQATGLAFWLEYWIAAHRHLLAHANDARLLFVDFARLASSRDVDPLAAHLDLGDGATLRERARDLRPLSGHDVAMADVPPAIREPLREIHAELVRRAVR